MVGKQVRMAKPQQCRQEEFMDKVGFKRIQLFKKNTLGIGSYGKVCQAKCDDLLCAAKLMHETLFDPTSQHLTLPGKEHRLPIRRFEKECGYLNSVRHPNIVQCLCIFEDTDTGLPVLLMELMDQSLTHFLDTSPNPIPYHVQVTICHDITLALSHLHSNRIVHRDLSSNNVLLIGNVRAKLSDFGMAKLGDLSHTFTMCPGTDVYMPPESVDDKPIYTEKIDCFAFGVIIVQILTRLFPKPDERYKIIEIYHPQIQGRKVKVSVPEVDRRQTHIDLIVPEHPLLQIALDCLKDRYDDRPSAQKLCETISTLKESPEYHKSNETVSTMREEVEKELRKKNMQELHVLRQTITDQKRSLDEKDASITKVIKEKNIALTKKDETIACGQWENQQLRQQVQQCMDESEQLRRKNEEIVEEYERQLGCVRQQLELSEHARAEFEREYRELEGKVAQVDPPRMSLVKPPDVSSDTERRTTSTVKIRWTKGKRAPCKMSAPITATLHNNAIYIRPPGNIIYAYSEGEQTWTKHAKCPTSNGPLVTVNNLLTLVGGCDNDHCLNKLFSLTGEGSGRKWSQEFPPMPTKRYGTAVLCAGIALIVAGGVGEEGIALTVVEILNTETSQWSTAAKLLEPLVNSLVVVCDCQIYMLGGEDKEFEPNNSVHTCALTALLKSTNPKSTAVRFKETLRRSNKPKVWSQVAALPTAYSSCAFLHGCLLAIGGKDSEHNPTAAVHAYVPTTDTWEIISHMITPRHSCFAAVLSDNQLLVVGGVIDRVQTKTDTIEIGSLLKLIIA